MKPTIEFFVAGTPKPAGSKRGFYIPKINRVVITDACKGSKDWKTDVKHTAMAHYQGPLWDCPIALHLAFRIQRPKGHYGTGKNAANIKVSAPAHPTTKPDVLKLARGVEDALTAVIWKDDSFIVRETLTKSYAEQPGVTVTISEAT